MEPQSVKRKDHDEDGSPVSTALILKKQKTGTDGALIAQPPEQSKTLPRTSGLQAPIMLLSGHKAEAFSVKFSPSGRHLASASFDKTILLWNVYGDCENYMMLKGHSNAVLEAHWSYDESNIFSASADKSVAMWDSETGARVKKFVGHTAVVNSCCPTRRGLQFLVSGSDDATVKLWDGRVKRCISTFSSGFPVTAVAFSQDADKVFSAGVDNTIKVWELRKAEVVLALAAHEDTVTGLELSHDGSYLLSNSMDQTVRIWDVKPFAVGNRNIKTFYGVQHNFEKTLLRCAWSPDGSKISAGSADRFVYVWDTESRKILYKLPGHKGSVNEVDFHPKEPIIASASSDKTIFLGEIKAQ